MLGSRALGCTLLGETVILRGEMDWVAQGWGKVGRNKLEVGVLCSILMGGSKEESSNPGTAEEMLAPENT